MAESLALRLLDRLAVWAEALLWWACRRRSELILRRTYRLARKAAGPSSFVVREGWLGRDRDAGEPEEVPRLPPLKSARPLSPAA